MCNYVQKSQEGPRKAPPDEDYENSHDAFKKIIEEYQPDLIIVWGWRLWGKITKHGIEADFPILENKKFYYFETNSKKIPAFGIPHPSSSAISDDWIPPYLQAAIEKA